MDISEIRIYQTSDGQTAVEVRIEKDTIWLNQIQCADLFQTERSVINKHILNIYKTGELDEKSTCAKFAQVQTEGNRKVNRHVNYYNLDMIIALGYRVNSKRGTEFRIWANKILREYLVKGYVINIEKLQKQNAQLLQIKQLLSILNNVSQQQVISTTEYDGLLKVVTDFAYALDILDKYDNNSLSVEHTTTNFTYRLTYTEAINQINLLKRKFGYSHLFGKEKDKSFQSSIDTIYQTFEGKDLYPSIEEKAAHLLYFIVKNHSFVDGNKRIAATLFLYFLERNNLLYNKLGEKRIADNALVGLTLLTAVSSPIEKDTIIKVIINLINRNN